MTVLTSVRIRGQDTSEARMVAEVARDLLAPLATERPDDPWSPLVAAGWIGVGVSEERGGSGGGLLEAAALAEAVGATAGQMPVFEGMLAALIVAQAAESERVIAEMTRGELTATVTPQTLVARRRGRDYTLLSRTWRAHWSALADVIVGTARIDDGPAVVLVPTESLSIHPGSNVAGEPREVASVEDADLPESNVLRTSSHPAGLDALIALLSASRLVGALGAANEISLEHARERRQFDRPIGAFQAVAHRLATSTRHVEMARAGMRAALERIGTPEASIASMAARVLAGHAAERVAAGSHQVHGAIGVTREHPLHRYTLRLLAWCQEFGSKTSWERRLGREVIRVGPDWWEQTAPEGG